MEENTTFITENKSPLTQLYWVMRDMILCSAKFHVDVVTEIAVEGLNYPARDSELPKTIDELNRVFDIIMDRLTEPREKFIAEMAYLMRADQLVPDDIATLNYYNTRQLVDTGVTVDDQTLLVYFGSKHWIDKKLTSGKAFLQNLRPFLWPTEAVEGLFMRFEYSRNMEFFDRKGYMNVQVVFGLGKELSDSSMKGVLTEQCKTNKNNYVAYFGPSSEYSGKLREAFQESTELFSPYEPSIVVFPELSMKNADVGPTLEYIKNNMLSTKLAVFGCGDHDRRFPNQACIVSFLRYDTHATFKKEIYYKKRPSSATWESISSFVDRPGDLRPTPDSIVSEKLMGDEQLSLIFTWDCVIGVAICSDVVDFSDDQNPIHRYADIVDVLIIISANSSDTEMFMASAESMARWHNCAVIYANDINSVPYYTKDDKRTKKLVELSFAIAPNKKEDSTTALCGDVLYLQELPATTGYINKHSFMELSKEREAMQSGEKFSFIPPDDPFVHPCVIFSIIDN